MKINWNKKYTTISIYTIITVTILLLIIAFFVNFTSVLQGIAFILRILTPIIFGFALAYLLYRPARFFENKCFAFIERNKPHAILRRNISIFALYLIVLIIFALLIMIIVPQLALSSTLLFQNIPQYVDTMKDNFLNWLHSINIYNDEIVDYINDFQNSFLNFSRILTATLNNLPSLLTSVGSGVLTSFIVVIVSIYALATKEKFMQYSKKIAYGILKEKYADKFIKILHYSNNVFLGFILGTLASSALVAIATFIFMTIMGMPYALLIAIIVFCTNNIPFFGPIIGAIPSTIILLMVDPVHAIIYVIFSVIIQQIDGNIILPRLVSQNIGLSAFWILFSLLLFGGIFGFWGMVLGVPIFTIIYSLIVSLINYSLEKKGIPPEKFLYPMKKAPVKQRKPKQKTI